MPAMPMADSSAPIVVGMRQTSSETMTMPVTPLPLSANVSGTPGLFALEKIASGCSVATANTKMIVNDGQQDVQRDLVGRLLPVGALDERDHPVDEALAGLLGDLDDDAVRQHRGAAGDRGPVAAGLADDRCRFAGDRRLVHRGNAFHDVAVAGDGLAGFDDDDVALLQQRRGDLLFAARCAGRPADEAAGHGVGLGLAQRSRPAPCRGLRRRLRRGWRRSPSATARPRSARRTRTARRSPGPCSTTAPISTMNMTGLRHSVRGLSLRSASGSDFHSIFGIEQAALNAFGRVGFGCVAGAESIVGADISGFLQRGARARAWAGR